MIARCLLICGTISGMAVSVSASEWQVIHPDPPKSSPPEPQRPGSPPPVPSPPAAGPVAAPVPRVTAPASSAAEPFSYQRPGALDISLAGEEPGTIVAQTRQEILRFTDVHGDPVPVLLTLPERRRNRLPPVILIHGFGSDKEHVSLMMAKPFIEAGFGCVALDLPFHGQREGKPPDMFPADDIERTRAHVIQAVTDTRQVIDLIESRQEFDTSRGVGLVGYSIGSWIATLTAKADPRIKAVTLMVGGALTTEVNSEQGRLEHREQRRGLLEVYPEVRPLLAIGSIAPRPVLMMNGQRDPLIPRDSVRALFEAAKDPRELRWYESGHLLPTQAYIDAASWMRKLLTGAPGTARR